MANTTDTLDPEAQQDALNRRLAMLGGGNALDAGPGGAGALQVPVPGGAGSESQFSSDTGIVPAPTAAPSAAQDMAETRAAQNAQRSGDLLGAQRQNALENRIGVRIGDLNTPGGPGLYNPAATGGFVGGNVAGPAGPSNTPVLDALSRRLTELQKGASSTPTTTNPAGVAAVASPDSSDRNAPTVPGQPTPASPSGAGMGPTGTQPPLVPDKTGAFVPNPSAGTPTTTPQGTTPASPTTPTTPTTSTPATPATPAAPGAGTGAIGGAGGTPSGGAIDMGGFLNQLNDIQKAINGNTPSDATAVYAAGLKNILDMLNQQEQSLRADAANGKVIDPQTQQALDALTKNLSTQLQHTEEELNRRGLYSSGILADLENKLRTGNASDQANLLNDRLARMQSDLQKQLSGLNQNRFSAASGFYLKGAEAQTAADELTRKLRGDLVGQRMGQIAAQQAAAHQQAAAAALEKQRADAAAAENEKNRQNALAIARLAHPGGTRATTGVAVPQINNAFGGSTKTPNVSGNATNNMIQVALGNLRSTPNGTNAPQILDDLYANAPALSAQGIDVQAIEDAIKQASDLGADYTRGNRTVGGPI